MAPLTISDFINTCDNRQVVGFAHKINQLYNRPLIGLFLNEKGGCIIQQVLNELFSVPDIKRYTKHTKHKVITCFRKMVGLLIRHNEMPYGRGLSIKKTFLSNVNYDVLGNNNEYIKKYPHKAHLINGTDDFENIKDEGYSLDEIPEEILNDLLKDYEDRDNEYEFIHTPDTNNLLDKSNEVLIKKMEKMTFEILAIQNALKIRAVK